jgi:cytochrome P450
MVRGWIAAGDQEFFAQMREQRPILALPQVTLAFRHSDVMLVLRRHDDFGVDLYKPKQGAYFMAQDDTAAHWREESVMKAVLDFKQVPAIRAFVAARTAAVLAGAGGRIDLVAEVTRPVPAAVVQEVFGLDGIAAEKLIEWSCWN